MNQFVDDKAGQTLRITSHEVGIDEDEPPMGHPPDPRTPQATEDPGSGPNVYLIGIHWRDSHPKRLGVIAGFAEDASGVHPTTTLTRLGGRAITRLTSCPSIHDWILSDPKASSRA